MQKSDCLLLQDLLESMVTSFNTSNKTIMHVVFTDFDMIVVDDIGCVFEDHPAFDIALTYRINFKQPINSGVIMVRGTLRSLSRSVNMCNVQAGQ